MLTRTEQLMAALAWARDNHERSVDIKLEFGESEKLFIFRQQSSGISHTVVIVKLEDGDNFTAILDAKEQVDDEKELHSLQTKLNKIE